MDLVYLSKGAKATYNDKEVIITRMNTMDTVTVEEISTGVLHVVHVSHLVPIPSKREKLEDINVLSSEKWETAQKRFDIIKPILENPGNLELVEKIAAEEKIGRTTLYAWVKLYKEYGTISAVLGKPKTGGKGKSRLLPEQEEIIKKYISSTYLNKARSSIKKTIRLIIDECNCTLELEKDVKYINKY